MQAALGVFHHVVLRYNCTQLDLFLDGVKQSTSAFGKRKMHALGRSEIISWLTDSRSVGTRK